MKKEMAASNSRNAVAIKQSLELLAIMNKSSADSAPELRCLTLLQEFEARRTGLIKSVAVPSDDDDSYRGTDNG